MVAANLYRLGSSFSASPLADTMRTGIARIERELGLPDEFPTPVLEAAEEAATRPRLPEVDRTDLEMITIDPAGARDLDQALQISRRGAGFRVHYAIADVAAFVTPGDPVDAAAHERVVTMYGAGSRLPLHPPAISEGAGSLLPDQVRPALLWTIDLDRDGEFDAAAVERALVRSRAQLDYVEAQRMIDDGRADTTVALLAEVGRLREEREAEREGVSLALPEQEVTVGGGHWDLEFRTPLPSEGWNAQISLLTGMAAASMMMAAKIGLLRVLPPVSEGDLARLRRTAKALDVEWPSGARYPEFVRTLDPAKPAHAALITASARLLRGSGYAGFQGTLPEQAVHSAVAAPYAHVTAPLRRLADRYAGEICVALSAGREVPDWVRAELDSLPEVMREGTRKANSYERAIVDLVEAGLLADRVGEIFHGVVRSVDDRDDRRGVVMIADPAVAARLTSDRPLPVGESLEVRLSEADLATRTVSFTT
ncbi:MAG: RNB domain-containing ribonuclease [Nocardioides sp.]